MSFPIIDLHNDTFSKKLLFQQNPIYTDFLKARFPETKNFIDVNKQRAVTSNLRIQTQSLFLMNSFMDKPLKYSLKIAMMILNYIRENKEFYVLRSKKDIDLKNKYGIMISIEGLEVIEGDLDLLDVFYELGVRIIAPTWNRMTPWLSPVTEATGAFSKAKDLAVKLNSLNVIVDISHLSDRSAIDFSRIYTGQMIASHSNLRALNKNKRNLSDSLIDIIRDRKGLIGINFCPGFLKSQTRNLKKRFHNLNFHNDINYDKDYDLKNSHNDKYPESFLWILNILEYLDKKSALDCVSFGTDLDGISEYSAGLENHTSLLILVDFFKKIGLPHNQIEKLYYKNALKVLTNSLD